MGLPKRARTGDHLKTEIIVNVFCLKDKGKILFSGGIADVADYIGITPAAAHSYLRKKIRCKKKYALRYAKQTNQ